MGLLDLLLGSDAGSGNIKVGDWVEILRYDEIKRDIELLTKIKNELLETSVKSPVLTGMPSSHNPDSVEERIIMKRDKLQRKIDVMLSV